MDLLEIDEQVVNSRMKFDSVIDQSWFQGIQNLFRLIGEKASESGFDATLLCQVLRTLILEAGTALERRLPYADLLEKWMRNEITKEELLAKEAEAIHDPCNKPYYPRTCVPHPIIKPAVAVKRLISDYLLRLEIESPK